MMGEQKMQQMAVAMARKQRMQRGDREKEANAPFVVKGTGFGENTLLSSA